MKSKLWKQALVAVAGFGLVFGLSACAEEPSTPTVEDSVEHTVDPVEQPKETEEATDTDTNKDEDKDTKDSEDKQASNAAVIGAENSIQACEKQMDANLGKDAYDVDWSAPIVSKDTGGGVYLIKAKGTYNGNSKVFVCKTKGAGDATQVLVAKPEGH